MNQVSGIRLVIQRRMKGVRKKRGIKKNEYFDKKELDKFLILCES